MTSDVHEAIVGTFTHASAAWRIALEKSRNKEIQDAAQTLLPHGNRHVRFGIREGEGAENTRAAKSPDGGIHHSCSLEIRCKYPALVFEVAFTHEDKKELRKEVEKYILRSNGEVRTVVAVDASEIYAAERKNENRLKKMYRTGQVDESAQYSYFKDENNITAGASILVWRATVRKNNILSVGRVQEKKFRDETGNAIQSGSLRIPLEDCVCKGNIDSAKRSKAPPLEILSEDLCKAIDRNLVIYRDFRAEEAIKYVQKKQKEKADEEERERQREEERLRRATEVRTGGDVGVFGLIRERGRTLSARIKDGRF
ncbi:hypothetical protein F5Y10DRAFT_235651 [Nemania abortiva]|nr:hypothetical protein F5Y10DRAFT_235651 [Nemania abortiva]